MMFNFNFLHRFFNPHCEHCASELRERLICESCEILKQQLALVNNEKADLLKIIVDLNQPKVIERSEPVNITQPKNIPWRVRQQMLEMEDRKRAQLMREAPKPLHTTEELETELGVNIEESQKENIV